VENRESFERKKQMTSDESPPLVATGRPIIDLMDYPEARAVRNRREGLFG